MVELELVRGKKTLGSCGFIGVSRFSVLGQMISDIEIFIGSDFIISFAKPERSEWKYKIQKKKLVIQRWGTINNTRTYL